MTAQWPLVPIRRIGRIISGGTPGGAKDNWSGDVPFVTPPDMRPVHGHQIVETSRTISKTAALTGSSIFSSRECTCVDSRPYRLRCDVKERVCFNQGCRAISPFESVCARYLSYALQCAGSEFAAIGPRHNVAWRFRPRNSGRLNYRCPASRSSAIADYLDRETAQIDALIEKQEQLVATLRERRAATIAEGFNRWPALQDHTLKRVAAVQTGVTIGGESSRGDLFEVPYLRVANVQSVASI